MIDIISRIDDYICLNSSSNSWSIDLEGDSIAWEINNSQRYQTGKYIPHVRAVFSRELRLLKSL